MKTAVITGASTGIGMSVSLEFARNGFEVHLIARSKELLKDIKMLIEGSGGKAKIHICDLSSIDSVRGLVKEFVEAKQPIDVLANIAGVWHGKEDVYAGKDFETFDQQVIIDTFMVGTIAPSLLVHGLLPLMKKGSRIINLSGTFENGGKGWIPYFVSKRALEDLTVGLAQELEEKGIYVNCISPSDTATESYAKFFPEYMEEAMDPLEIAEKFVELATSKNTTTGKIIVMKKGSKPKENFHF